MMTMAYFILLRYAFAQLRFRVFARFLTCAFTLPAAVHTVRRNAICHNDPPGRIIRDVGA
jgi:hypothetical protein